MRLPCLPLLLLAAAPACAPRSPANEEAGERAVVRPESPLTLTSNRQDPVAWPVWGAVFRTDETVRMRTVLRAGSDAEAMLVLAGPDGPGEGGEGDIPLPGGRSTIELAWTGTHWTLRETDGLETQQEVPLSVHASIAVTLEVEAGAAEIRVSGIGFDARAARDRSSETVEQVLVAAGTLAAGGEDAGAYVRLAPGAELEIRELFLDQPLPAFRSLGTPLRDLASARGIAVGSAVDVWPPLHDRGFEALLGAQFDLAAPTELYWTSTRGEDPDYFFLPADLIVNYAGIHDQRVTGMFLVWDFELPPWLVALAGTGGAPALGAALDEHIATTVGRYRGRIDAWVVVNEALAGPEESGTGEAGYAGNVWLDTLGPEYVERAFAAARAADPDATLLYNETGAEALGDKSDFLYGMAADFVTRGVPLDGVGLQFHVDAAAPPDFDDVRANFERLGALGLDVYVTELDVSLANTTLSPNEALARQAEIYVEVLDACLAVPACRAYTVFGFSDRYAWDELGDASPLLFDEAYEPKPAFRAVQSRLGPQ